MGDIIGELGKEELSVRIDNPGGVDGVEVEGVAPGVLAAVVVGVLGLIVLLFAMGIFMDRWRNRKIRSEEAERGWSGQSTRIPIIEDIGTNPTSDPPAVLVSMPDTSSEC